MTDHEHSPETLDDFEVPEHWTAEARDTFEQVMEERPDLGAEDFSSLLQAVELISTADRLDEVARKAGFVQIGSQGQERLHEAVSESRLSRTAAAAILRQLRRASGDEAKHGSPSERARRAARARWQK